ncbi:hypothetical protein GPL15_03970 [Clostridium sp. MCC353]|uniref:hypothetical protein n=1 Tax=Clostridium sp. MCC353 TaxID=2592646 RepID=UPI001C02EB6A|nr:hypothetical protein [Clostridium sp. MCC353]MBT9775669.1 hypothetical protein [Clostridium sp. MCC353]
MKIKDPFWRSYELYLRRLIYRGKYIHDDYVIEPVIEVPLVFHFTGWGIQKKHKEGAGKGGSWGFCQTLKTLEEVRKLKDIDVLIDRKKTGQNYEAVKEVFGDSICVRQDTCIPIRPALLRDLAELRGLEQLMYDLVDDPELVHEGLSFMADSYIRLIKKMEREHLIAPNNRNHYVGSGGVGFCRKLEPESGNSPGCLNMWGFGEAQELALVSPSMYEEFAVEHLKPVLNLFGLNCFACCESLDGKYEIIKSIKNLRRVSVSPWSDLKLAVQALEDRYLISWKPNPTIVGSGFDKDRAAKDIRRALELTKDCHMEIIMKDLITVNKKPENLFSWLDMVKREIGR